jgi:hypothetical protein
MHATTDDARPGMTRATSPTACERKWPMGCTGAPVPSLSSTAARSASRGPDAWVWRWNRATGGGVPRPPFIAAVGEGGAGRDDGTVGRTDGATRGDAGAPRLEGVRGTLHIDSEGLNGIDGLMISGELLPPLLPSTATGALVATTVGDMGAGRSRRGEVCSSGERDAAVFLAGDAAWSSLQPASSDAAEDGGDTKVSGSDMFGSHRDTPAI